MSVPSQKSVQASRIRSAEPCDSIWTLSVKKRPWVNDRFDIGDGTLKLNLFGLLFRFLASCWATNVGNDSLDEESRTNREMRWDMGGWRLVKQ